jgi:VanZ family protein
MLMRVCTRLPAVAVALAIWMLSSQSTLPQPKGILGWDKFQHLAAYGVLAAAIGLWVSSRQWKSRGLLWFALVAAIASIYGVTDEIHQSFVPGRNCNVWDWIADTLGALLGTGAIFFVFRLGAARKKRRSALDMHVETE